MDKKNIFIIVFVVFLAIANSTTAAAVKLDNPLGATDTICELLTKISKAVAGLVGAISVIMIIVAGIMYLLSAGSPEKMGTAKKAFFYAIIGLVIAISAGAIVNTIKSVINASGGGC